MVHFPPVLKPQSQWALLWQSSPLPQHPSKSFWWGTELKNTFIYSKAIKHIVLLIGKNETQQPITRCIAPVPCSTRALPADCWLPGPQQAALVSFFLLTPAERIHCWACLWLMRAWQPPRELPREKWELLHLSWRVRLCGWDTQYLL